MIMHNGLELKVDRYGRDEKWRFLDQAFVKESQHFIGLNLKLHGVHVRLLFTSEACQLAWQQIWSKALSFEKNLAVDLEVILYPQEESGHLNWDQDEMLAIEGRYKKDSNTAGPLHLVHRDFCAKELAQDKFLYIGPTSAKTDGLYNFLRWALPRYLLKQKKFLIHSSVVVNDRDEGLIFLGASEAGKSTLAQMAWDQKLRALGDDMNIVSSNHMVEGAMLGQGQNIKTLLGEEFKIKAALAIFKSTDNALRPSDKAMALRYWLLSCCNLLSSNFAQEGIERQCLDLLSQKALEIPFYQLHFNRQLDLNSIFRQV